MQDDIVEDQEGQLSPNLEARLYRVDGHPHPQRRIELRISPWVSEKEVRQAYLRKQEQVLGGGRHRLPEPRTLGVGRFVREQERLNGYRRPKWRVLLEQWNKRHPEDLFKKGSDLCTYFGRADKAVKELNFGLP